MNNKYLLGIGVAVVVVVAAGVLLLGKGTNSGTNNTTTNQPTDQTQTTDQTPPVEDVNVTVTSAGFEPATVTVKAGGRVIWTNSSGATANVSSELHPTHLLFPFLNLGDFSDGSTVSVTFDKAGTYTYHNHLDASQKGTVVVQ